MSKLRAIYSPFRRDLPRALFFLFTVIIVTWTSDWFPKYIGHPEYAPLLTSVYMILVLVAFGHLMRRVLFHRLDIQTIALKANESSIGASIVFFAMCLVLSVLIFCLTIMLH